MQSQVVEGKEKSQDFPKLMELKNVYRNQGNVIVLFTKDEIGMVVHSDTSSHQIGSYEKFWDMKRFIDFNGSVTLKN